MAKSETQTFLAFIMVGILCIGFVGVWYVDAYYEQQEPTEILWVSDSSSDTDLGYTLENPPFATWDYVHTGQIVGWTGSPYTFETYNRTGVYIGNNTWSYSANETTGNYHNQARWYFDMPNIENWIITDVNVSFSTNGDSDLEFVMGFDYPIDYNVDYDAPYKRGTAIDHVYSFSPTNDHYFRNVSVPLETALDINNNVNNIPNVNPMYVFSLIDADDDGLSAFAFTISITIHGYKVDATSMIDQISIIIGASVGINIVAIIYLTDKYDIGGYVRDIPKRRK